MKYAQQFQIAATKNDENYKMYLKYAKGIIKDIAAREYGYEGKITFKTQKTIAYYTDRRFKRIPYWFKFLSVTRAEEATIVIGWWEA